MKNCLKAMRIESDCGAESTDQPNTRAQNKEIDAVIASGKGRLTLETPIESGEETVTELIYDFTELSVL